MKKFDKKKCILLSFLVVSSLSILLFSIEKISYSEFVDIDNIEISCPLSAQINEEIECSVITNMVSVNGLAFQSDIVLDNELIYDGYNANMADEENSWGKSNVGLENQIIAVSSSLLTESKDESNNGLLGEIVLGRIKLKISEDAELGENYKIRLTNSKLIYNDFEGKSQVLNLNDQESEIHVLSDNNILSGITLSIGSLNETFSSDKNIYTANIDSDKVTITPELFDSTSTLSGDIGDVYLHYGTNLLKINVTSESGIANTYEITVYRQFIPKNGNYLYNGDYNYIYTKNDINSDVIINNLSLENGLKAIVDNNNLIVSYQDEKLSEIKVINFSFDSFTLIDNLIYIGEKNSTLNDFKANGVTFKLFDLDGNETTSNELFEGYTVKVYYGDSLIDELFLTKDHLNFNSTLSVDNNNMVIKRIKPNSTYDSVINEINTNGNISIKGNDNKNLYDKDTVKTGDKIIISLSNSTKEYYVSVLGDISGNGKVNSDDVDLLYKHLNGKNNLKNYQFAAGDIINDGVIKINDVSRLNRFYKGYVNTLEVK